MTEEITRLTRELAMLRHEKRLLAERETLIRERLHAHVEERGIINAKGSYVLPLPAPISVGEKTIHAVERRRVVKIKRNADTAERLALAKGVHARLFQPVPTFDEQELYVMAEEGVFSQEDLAEIETIEETYSLVTIEE